MMMASTKKSLSIRVLVLDGGTQSRVAISEVTVEEYIEVLANTDGKWPFPHIDVFHDGSQYLVAAGFHRTLAAIRCGRASIPCIVHQGTAFDALLFGMASNNEHGLRPTQADKRHSVELLLDSKPNLKQQQIADMAGVVLRTVSQIVSDRKSENTQSACFDPEPNTDDPFGWALVSEFIEGEGEDGRTDSDGQDAQQELPPRSPRNGKEESGGSSSPAKQRTPAEEFKIQKSKTVKTAEALVRAFDDLNRIRKSNMHAAAISDSQELIIRAKNWQ